MKKNNKTFCLLFVLITGFFPLISLTSLQTTSQLTYADTIFINTNAIALDSQSTIADAIAFKGDVILAIGSNYQVLAFQGPNTKVYSLKDKWLIPGFVDGHTHFFLEYMNGNTGYNMNLTEVQQFAFSYGYTTLVEKSVQEWMVGPLQEAEENQTLKIRLNLFPYYNLAWPDANKSAILDVQWFPVNPPILEHDKLIRVTGIKVFVDGSFSETRGAWAVSEPFSKETMEQCENITDNEYGDMYWSQEELSEVFLMLQEAGFRVACHTMGDRAIDTVLNSIEACLSDNETNEEYRHQIEHNSLLRPDQIERMRELKTIHSVRGYFPTYSQDAYVEFLPDRYELLTNRYALPDAGIHTYLETDFTWGGGVYNLHSSRSINPFLHLWGYVTRKSIDNEFNIYNPDDWVSKHEITVEQALKTMTSEGAFAVSMEDWIGTLETDKFADVIILPKAPMNIDHDDLKDLYVLATIVGGELVYEHSEFSLEEYRETTPTSTETDTTTTMTSTMLVTISPGFAPLVLIFSLGMLIILRRKD